MRTLNEKYLGGLELSEDIYKVDLAVLDRYQSFSSELLRLSLLGIAGYGFLLSNTVLKPKSDIGPLLPASAWYAIDYLLPLGVVMFGFSAASALGHRYFSTDCMSHYVRRIRLLKKGTVEGRPDHKKTERIIKHEAISLKKDLLLCKWLLLGSSIFLLIGAGCVAWSFASTMVSMNSR